MKEITIDFIKREFLREGYTLLEDEYKNSRQKLRFRCSQGHEHCISWDFWKRGIRCVYCTKKTISIKSVRQAFKKEGYELLSTEYKNARSKLKYICPEGHEGVTEWKLWKAGHRCWLCANQQGKERKRVGLSKIKKLLKKEGYELLSSGYQGQHDRLKMICSNDHSLEISFAQWRQGKRCLLCEREQEEQKRIRKFYEFKKMCENEGYEILSDEQAYKAHDKIKYKCPKGHVHYVSRVNWNSGVRCPFCSNTISKAQQTIFEKYLELNPQTSRQIIPPWELDLYFSDQKIAIEYCGLYWHSEANPYYKESQYAKPSYHYNKLRLCNEKGIRLITIFEDEWINNKEICLSRINAALGIRQVRIFARKCELKKVSSKEAKDFLQKHHLQGSSGREIAFGLFYEESLVSVMTLGKPSRAHVNKKMRTLELKRFASLPNHIIVGGASKLFKAAVVYAKQQEYQRIVSYCDLRWGTGRIYERLGMKEYSRSKYTLHYTDGKIRWRNQAFAGNKEKSEKDKINAKNLYRIYDCGHISFEYII